MKKLSKHNLLKQKLYSFKTGEYLVTESYLETISSWLYNANIKASYYKLAGFYKVEFYIAIAFKKESDLSMFLMRFDEELTNNYRSSKTYQLWTRVDIIAMKFQEKFENIKN